MHRNPITMHEARGCSGRRVACDSANREVSMGDEIVFRVNEFSIPRKSGVGSRFFPPSMYRFNISPVAP
jgi:hypothetical protein